MAAGIEVVPTDLPASSKSKSSCGDVFPRRRRGKTGESVYAVRTASDEAWGVFLREFKRWCASEEICELVKHLPALP